MVEKASFDDRNQRLQQMPEESLDLQHPPIIAGSERSSGAIGTPFHSRMRMVASTASESDVESGNVESAEPVSSFCQRRLPHKELILKISGPLHGRFKICDGCGYTFHFLVEHLLTAVLESFSFLPYAGLDVV